MTTVCLGFVGGAALAPLWPQNSLIIWVCGAMLITLAFWRLRRVLLIAACVGGLLFGLGRGTLAMGDIAKYKAYYGHQVTMTGTVADDVDIKPQGAHMTLKNIHIDDHNFAGTVFATVKGGNEAKRSDEVAIKGMMSEGFGGFGASIMGDIVHVQRPVPGDVALSVRDGFASDIRQAIAEPEASLGIGYLLGQKSALPSDLVDALKIAGLTHIVVASGYNLTILVRIGRRLFAKISKYLAMLTSSGLIVAFIAMTGLSPSMTRAGLVAGLALWAWYYGRKFHPVTLLAIAASVTVLVNPSYVWGDLGWLLSFAAFAGVMIIAPIATAYFFGEENIPFIGQLFIETISAQIATLPIMIIAFQQLSIIAPVANLLILPIIPLIMLLVAVAGIGVLIIPTITGVIGWPAEQLLHLQIAIINWCADIPWALEKPEWQWWGAVFYIAIIAVVIAHMKFRSGYKLYTASVVE
jgi:competence protein ComEC